MEQKLVLQDGEGQVVRAFQWSGRSVHVIRRADTQRLELIEDFNELERKKVAYQKLGTLEPESIRQKPLLIGQLGELRFVENIERTIIDEENPEENKRIWRGVIFSLGLLFTGFIGILQSIPLTTPKMEEELIQEVVKIVKSVSQPKVAAQRQGLVSDDSVTPSKKTVSVKRMGALSVLGSLKSGKQKGGLNLGAAQTSAGPGLGGTQGSGGTQTSIYAKGIVSAPLGAGGNVKGAGGYGTKGKGGGQAGYGNLSLVGSTGAAPIPLGGEAIIAQGLDRDQIAAVINRNLGQVRFCYEQGLQSDPNLNGRVSIAFTIGGNGLVKAANVASTTLNAKVVEECIALRLKSWKFPLPEGGVDVKVTYPFVLRRTGQG